LYTWCHNVTSVGSELERYKAINQDIDEQKTQGLEAQLLEMAARATRQAYEAAKRSGLTVVLSKGGFIVAEYPDGTELKLAPAKPKRKVRAGVSIDLRSGSFLGAV